MLFDSRRWQADRACGAAAVAVERFLAGHLPGSAATVDSIDAVSIRREQWCGFNDVHDSVGEYSPLRYAIEIDVHHAPQLATVRIDPIDLTGAVGQAHRGEWLNPRGPLVSPRDVPDSATREGHCQAR